MHHYQSLLDAFAFLLKFLPRQLPLQEIHIPCRLPEAASASAVSPVSFAGAQAAYREGDFTEAADLFARWREGNPRDVWGPYMQGLSLWKSGRADLAEEPLRAALELEPDHSKSLVNLARVLLGGCALPLRLLCLFRASPNTEPQDRHAR